MNKLNTVHIFREPLKSNKALIEFFYKKYLKNDPDFFYCLEPDLIIRCGKKAEKQIVKELERKEFKYDVYDYPKSPKNWMYSDEDTENLDILIPIWHLIAVAHLTLTYEEYAKIRERVFHLFINMHFQDWETEAYIYTKYAARRLELDLTKKENE